MKKIKLLTMALLPITTVGATIGMASCSSSTPALQVIKSKYLLHRNIEILLKDNNNINNHNEFMDIITSSEEIERVRAVLTDKSVTELKIIKGSYYSSAYKTITSNFNNPSFGLTQAKVEVVIKLQSSYYLVTYKTSTGLSQQAEVRIDSPPIEKKIYGCIYQFEGMYDFPLNWTSF